MSQAGQYITGAMPGPFIETLTGNSPSTAVGPSVGGNINIVGLGAVDVTDVGAPANTLNISVSGAGLKWNDVPTATQQLASNSGYITSHNGQITFYLPAAPVFGDVVRIIGNNVGGWFIDLTGGGFFPVGSIICAGTTGTSAVVSINIADQIELVCLNAASNAWIVATVTGPITIT